MKNKTVFFGLNSFKTGILIMLLFFCASIFIFASSIETRAATVDNSISIQDKTETSTTAGTQYYQTHGSLDPTTGKMIYAQPTGDNNAPVANPGPKKFSYILLESIPGFFNAGTTLTDLPALILAIYKFGIWTIGIAGLFMLVFGGFMYMTSAGNNSTAGNAKGIIWDALLGIIAALGSYLILYVINPDLTRINLSFTTVNVSEFGGPTGTGNPSPQSANCKSDAMLAKMKSASQGKVDPCLTFALLNTESGCTANAQSPAGACGIAQLMPGTAGVSCATLKSDVDLSISKGIAYLLSNKGKVRGNLDAAVGNSFAQAAEDLYAGYNGGPGALEASKSCNQALKNNFGFSYVKWDCTVDSGGYKETQVAAPRFLNSYNACNEDATLKGKLK